MKIRTQFILCLLLEFARTQFTSHRRQSKTPCEVRGTALVEQFFNVIFAEFQHSPPTCICVQMCADQPTYCYPNGCFKKEKKTDSPISSIQQDTKTVFLVDNDKQVLEDLMGNMDVMSPAVAGTAERSYRGPWEHNLMGRAYPLKEIVFKYKRLPKLQMKYNLREQIKHARDKKAEVDLSKTRWPTNKQINRQTNHQRASNYLTSMFPETNQGHTPKYFKRYLTKRENQVGLDISALYLYKDASNFSLETLIDNLIERGLEGVNSTSTLKLGNSSKLKDEENNDDSKMNSVAEDLQNNTKEVALEISLVANGNSENDKENSSVANTTTAAYFEMITTLSNQIEKQNNLSLKVIENLTGNTFTVVDQKSAKLSNRNETAARFETVLKVPEETTKSTTNKAPSLHSIPVINSQVKKSKQRIVRKLRNRKLNK